jgi:hypothetical protein
MMLRKLVIQEILLLINLDSKGMSAVHVLRTHPCMDSLAVDCDVQLAQTQW